MNLANLKQAEADFLRRYPGGFQNPEILAIAKKHPVEKMAAFSHDAFAEHRFENPEQIITDMVSAVSRSSMVSMFEKPKFRDFAKTLSADEAERLSDSLYAQLYSDQAAGFEEMVQMLKTAKLAKWTLLTILPFYFHQQKEVFVKPNTTKAIIQYLELDLQYKPLPSWEFYAAYREQVEDMKQHVDGSLSPNNAAFTGFLMMSV